MKTSNILLCLAPTIAVAAQAEQVPPAVAPSPSVPNTTPPAPLPQIETPSVQDDVQLEIRQMVQVANLGPRDAAARVVADPVATAMPDQWPETSRGSIGLGTLSASPGVTKSLRARSEGTLGQTPWIGMAIGLTCTALAAVMLG